jgi:peptidoglycan/xylan/chitin deacetylase (PgdA/CDA1 family)
MWTALGIVVFFVLPGLILLLLLRSALLEYRKDRIPILLYHRLISREAAERGEVPDNEMIWVCYDTEFRKQMEYLHEAAYTTLDFDDYVEIRGGRMPMPLRPVIVEFDDGYLSNYTMAYPALKRHGQKATIFVPLEPDEHTRRQVEGIDGFINEEQMQEMSANGISIQSHTLTHRILNELDEETVRHELSEPIRRLEAITGRAVRHIAIPRGGYSRRIRQLVAEAGYQTACCNNKGSSIGSSDPLALPRIVVERDMSIDDFARLLQPRSAAVLRIVGNIKRIPMALGGARFARKVRDVLYIRPLQPIFKTRNLKKVVAGLALLYLIGSVWFAWHLIS